jgi:hypothetical protein
MARPALPLALLLPLLPLPALQAQPPGPPPRNATALLNTKDLARAKRQLMHADPGDLKQAQVEAARAGFEARVREFLAGRVVPMWLLDSAADLRNARLALAPREVDRLAALDAYWAALRHIDDVMEARYYGGKVGIRDYLLARYLRLGADIDLAHQEDGAKREANLAVLPTVEALFAPGKTAGGLLDTKGLARAKFEALRADPKVRRRSSRQRGSRTASR